MGWRRICPLSLLFCISVGLIGCSGGGNFPRIKGQVLLDGKAVSQARVEFKGETGGNVAMTDDEGKFEFDGSSVFKTLKVDKYKVTISKYVYIGKSSKIPEPEDYGQLEASGLGKNILPAAYFDPAFTPFTGIEIKEGMNELPPFQLKSKGK
jgi:hypothetical protein